MDVNLSALTQLKAEFTAAWATAKANNATGPEVVQSMERLWKLMEISENMFSEVTRKFTVLDSSIVEALVNGGPKRPYVKHEQDISEHKALYPLKIFSSNREQFIQWNDKLINALTRVHKGTREALKELNTQWTRRERELNNEDDLKEMYEEIRRNSPCVDGGDE